MVKKWFYLPLVFPRHDQLCVVRRVGSMVDFDAEYDSHRGVFVCEGAQELPWFMIVRWRPGG